MTDLTTSQVLDKAADLIEERGWTTGTLGWPGMRKSGDGPLCMEGGIIAALGHNFHSVGLRDFYTCPAYIAVQDYLGLDQGLAEDGGPNDPIWQWNDFGAGTAERVVATLRAASAVAETHTPAGLPGESVSA